MTVFLSRKSAGKLVLCSRRQSSLQSSAALDKGRYVYRRESRRERSRKIFEIARKEKILLLIN